MTEAEKLKELIGQGESMMKERKKREEEEAKQEEARQKEAAFDAALRKSFGLN